MRSIAAAGALALTIAASLAAWQGQAVPRAVVAPGEPAPKPDKFSPHGYYDLLAYQQAYPAGVGSPLVRQADATKYWVYQGIAQRGPGSPQQSAWISLGPLTTLSDSGGTRTVSGRVAALLISPRCELSGRCRLWVGTAGGGVWRTEKAMTETDPEWRWVGYGLGTNSIGSLATDPSDRSGDTIYVGTGETNMPLNSAAGTGLYRSTDGGDHWTRISTMISDPAVQPDPIDFTFTRGISSVVVDPSKPQTLYVATTTAALGMTAVRGGQTQTTGYPQPRVGLYKTEDRGGSWRLIWTPPFEPVPPANPNLGAGVSDTMAGVRHVMLDPRNSNILYAAAFNNGIYRSAPSLENGDPAFKPVFAIVNGAGFRDLAMFDLTVKNGHTRIYAYNGTEALEPQALYRLDSADVAASKLVTESGAVRTNTSVWRKMSSDDTGSQGYTSRRLCTSQCFYDLVVAVPENRPDTVIVGGVATPSFGEATIRSIDGGVSFSGHGRDAQSPRNSSHVDVRAVVFHPKNPDIAWVGSDGGVVRNDGAFSNITSRCASSFPNTPQCQTMLARVPNRIFFLNKGLQTMQFYNVAIDPQAPLSRLIGGLQDNSTIWYNGTTAPGVWTMLFPSGDGTAASGFHPTRSNVVFASFQSNNFFTNYRNGDLSFWVRVGDPIITSNELATIMPSLSGRQFITMDLVRPDTQFTGFQHVWRTENNGGPQAFLESNCRTSGGTSSPICGDWVPLGVSYPFAGGSNPASASRQPGDLTSGFYGGDRTGGIVVSAERTPADAGTLWAATNKGRLFVSKNVDGGAAAVTFTRIDTASTPERFVTRIVVDRADPNVAYVSYTGFNQITPATPGHVFRVVYNPSQGRATFTSVDFNLGDLPINTLAYDDLAGDLYAATDFGPLVLRRNATQWVLAGVGFPEVVMVDLEIAIERRLLVAATHGLGIYYLNLR